MAFQNFYATKLKDPMTSVDNTFTVVIPPTVTTGYLVIDPRNVSQREVISFTNVSGNTLTGVSRGLSPTTAKSHLAGVLVEMNVTSQVLDAATNINSNLSQYTDELLSNAIVSGAVWSTSASLTTSMTGGVGYINGVRFTIPAIATKTFPASQDTYVFFDINGAPTYTSVANNAAKPATPGNNVLNYKVVSSASAVTSVIDFSDKAITNDKISPEPWTVITPTFTNFTLGNGTVNSRWQRVGKTIRFRGRVVLGSTSAFTGLLRIDLPVPTSADYVTEEVLGWASSLDAGVRMVPCYTRLVTSSTISIVAIATQTGANPVYLDSSSNRDIAAAQPIVWGVGDVFTWYAEYESI